MLFLAIIISLWAILSYYKIFLAILNYFILGDFRLCETIINNFWLLKVISPYVIIDNSRLS
jgi:hypothetical protein